MVEDLGVTLTLLPSSLVEKILLHLEIQDIIHVGQTSSAFKEIVLSEPFWLRLLELRWGNVTRPSAWLTDSPCGCFELHSSSLQHPGTYRALYPVLREYEKMVGVWTDADRNSLCIFDWRSNCIQGTRLAFHSMHAPPSRSPFCRLSSEGQASINLQTGGGHCWLREYHLQHGRLRKSSCENAEAAARTAIGRNNADSSELMGSSPKGSFEHELLHFMQMSVSSKRRKSRSKSPGQATHPSIKCIYHLRSVELDQPTRAHPLMGMWKGDFGGFQGVQVVTISYDFSQRFAIIKGQKVGSHQDAYHEQPLWMSNAQACARPWSARDELLIERRPQYLVMSVASQPADANGASSSATNDHQGGAPWSDKTVGLSEINKICSSYAQMSLIARLLERNVPLAWLHDNLSLRNRREVVTCYRGKGRLLNTEDWYEGRLWQYRDGSLGFLCLVPDFEPDGILIDFERVSHELRG